MDASVVVKSERGRKKEKIYKEGNRDCQEGKVKTSRLSELYFYLCLIILSHMDTLMANCRQERQVLPILSTVQLVAYWYL